MSSILEVEHLTQTVSDGLSTLTILHDLSLSVMPGQSLAITGASGSGKSTLLGLCAGLDVPTSGRIVLAGHCITDMNEEARASVRAHHVGFVFQSFQLLDHLTALENVLMATQLAGLTDGQQKACEWLERVGLGHRLHAKPTTLSGGEQQRVALARAFVRQPSVIFADEPTGSLDHATGSRIIDLMFALQEESKATLILVTHAKELAARCLRQMDLREGKLHDA